MSAPIKLVATLKDHRHVRESWAVGTVLVVEVLAGDPPDRLGHFGAGEELAVVGDRLGLAAVGERLELHGDWERSKFGVQLKVSEQISRGIREPADACRWLERLDGVGPKTARALARHFGDHLPAILAGEEEADLTEVRGIGDDTARHIFDSFAEDTHAPEPAPVPQPDSDAALSEPEATPPVEVEAADAGAEEVHEEVSEPPVDPTPVEDPPPTALATPDTDSPSTESSAPEISSGKAKKKSPKKGKTRGPKKREVLARLVSTNDVVIPSPGINFVPSRKRSLTPSRPTFKPLRPHRETVDELTGKRGHWAKMANFLAGGVRTVAEIEEFVEQTLTDQHGRVRVQ